MKSLTTYGDASKLVVDAGNAKRTEFIKLFQWAPLDIAAGRIGAETIVGKEPVPPFNNSAMDGFAVRSQETTQATSANPLILNIHGRILAGDLPLDPPASLTSTCYEIMTGAPMPKGFDAVYKVEDVDIVEIGGKKVMRAKKPLEKFANYRKLGSDFSVGQKLFDAGTFIMAEHIMGLASIGINKIAVLRKPKIAVLTTGSELADINDQKLSPGKIRNSTLPYLLSAIPLFGADITSHQSVKDNEDVFIDELIQILKTGPDIILTTGAVSKGVHDFIPQAIQKMGAQIIFHNVGIRPGKPQLFAQFRDGGPAFFGIPGNPISTALGLRFFVNNYLNALQGKPQETPLRAILAEDVDKPKGLRCFYKGHLQISEKGVQITSLAGQSSYMVSSLLHANAWVALSEDVTSIKKGTSVEYFPLYPDRSV